MAPAPSVASPSDAQPGATPLASPVRFPDVPLVTGGCLEIRHRGDPDLAASPCSQLRPWVCEGLWAPQSSCPTGPGWSHWNGSCYLWDSSSAGAWPEALEACRRFRKTELLYLASLQEMDWVRSHFQGTFWTGLNDRKEESVFRWSALEPLNKQVAQRLRDDVANGGRKDCVWFDSASGLLSDASCGEERPFLCKCPEGTEWFDRWSGYGVVGEPSLLYPSAETLEGAKQECLLERPVCVAILETGSGFYLLSSKDDASPRADSVLHVWTICAEGFGGLACHKASVGAARPACDCRGTFETSAEKVCGVPVQTCVEDCQQTTPGTNCSFCIPVCTEASLSFLDPEEFALVTTIQSKVSHLLNLTAEDERDRRASSRLIYDVCSCSLGKVSCVDRGLWFVPLLLPTNATALLLDYNRIAILRDGSFAAQKALRRLSLSNNALASIHRLALVGLQELLDLDLSDNALSLLHPQTFLPVPTLRMLKLGNNRLLRLEADLPGSLPRLRALFVQSNALTSLPAGFFERLPSLSYLTLEGNPWACSCAIWPLFLWLLKNREKVPEANSVTCTCRASLAQYPILALGNGSFARCQAPQRRLPSYAVFLLIGPLTFLASICVGILLGSLAVARLKLRRTGSCVWS